MRIAKLMDRNARKQERERFSKYAERRARDRKLTAGEVDKVFGFDRMDPFRAGLAKLYFLYMSKQFSEAADSRDLLEDIFSWKSLMFFAALFALVGFVLYAAVRAAFG